MGPHLPFQHSLRVEFNSIWFDVGDRNFLSQKWQGIEMVVNHNRLKIENGYYPHFIFEYYSN